MVEEWSMNEGNHKSPQCPVFFWTISSALYSYFVFIYLPVCISDSHQFLKSSTPPPHFSHTHRLPSGHSYTCCLLFSKLKDELWSHLSCSPPTSLYPSVKCCKFCLKLMPCAYTLFVHSCVRDFPSSISIFCSFLAVEFVLFLATCWDEGTCFLTRD